jgi:hypothetical protein
MTSAAVTGRKHIASACVDLCDSCAAQVREDDFGVSIGRCADCARYCCTCWLERACYEGETRRRYFCAEGTPGGCQ